MSQSIVHIAHSSFFHVRCATEMNGYDRSRSRFLHTDLSKASTALSKVAMRTQIDRRAIVCVRMEEGSALNYGTPSRTTSQRATHSWIAAFLDSRVKSGEEQIRMVPIQDKDLIAKPLIQLDENVSLAFIRRCLSICTDLGLQVREKVHSFVQVLRQRMILEACQCMQRSRVLNGVDGRTVVTLDAVHTTEMSTQEHVLDATPREGAEANGTFDRQELRDDSFVIITTRINNISEVGHVQIFESIHRNSAQGACNTFDGHRRLWANDMRQFAEHQSVHFLTAKAKRMVARLE